MRAGGVAVAASVLTWLAPLARADDPLTLRATAEIETVDVEGDGGFANREPGLIHPRQRSPYVALDKATLEIGYPVAPRVRSLVELRADADRARIDRIYLDSVAIETQELRLRIEAGRQKPIERPPPRRVETYSPLGGLFWRGREWHLGAQGSWRLASFELQAMASAAMMRELGDQSMGEDPNLPAIAFVDTAVREDSQAELGGLVGGSAYGAQVALFGFRGRLLDNDGPERLRQTFPGYEDLGDETSRTERWYGARASYQAHRVHALAEAIRQDLGLLRRRGWELGASVAIPLCAGGYPLEIEPFLRHGRITLTNFPEQYLVPESWDRRQTVAAVLVRPSAWLEVKLEYIRLSERSGESSDGKVGVDDDQVLVQLRLDREIDP